MLLYLESVFAERRDRIVTRPETIPPTLNQLFLTAMRAHARQGPFLDHRGTRWRPMPDWRFDRHVIRLGLYLRERVGIEPGDHVAIVSEVRSEWFLADFAIAGLGAVSVAIDPTADGDSLTAALADTAPKAVFVSRRAIGRVEAAGDRLATPREIVALDNVANVSATTPLVRVLDIGGTLDTPERAQWWRGRASEAERDHTAVRHYEPCADGSLAYMELTQGEVRDAIASHWREYPACESDLAYLVAPEVTLAVRLALYGFVADGYTSVAFGNQDHAADEIAVLQPTTIIAPPAVLEGTVLQRLARANRRRNGAGVTGWIRSVATRTSSGRSRFRQEAVREALGGRARRISPTAPLEPHIAEYFNGVAAVDTNGAVPRLTMVVHAARSNP